MITRQWPEQLHEIFLGNRRGARNEHRDRDTTAAASQLDLNEIAAGVVRRAMQCGATAAECVIRDGTEFSTVVRLGEVETLKESGSQGAWRARLRRPARGQHLYQRSFAGGLAADGRLGAGAGEDHHAKTRSPAFPSRRTRHSSKAISTSTTTTCIRFPPPIASTMRAAPRRPRSTSIRASPTPKAAPSMPPSDARCWPTRMASSANTSAPTARFPPCPSRSDEQGNMQRDYWYSVARTLEKLESPESVGQTAAKRTLRRLGARKVKTAQVPDHLRSAGRAARCSDHIFEAVNGDTIYRNASFLAGKLGEQIAGENVTVIDDGTMRGGFGSSPFDSEGVPTRRTIVHRKRRAQVVPAEHLRRQEAWPGDHRQRLARAGRNPGHRHRQLLSGARRKDPGTDHRRRQRWPSTSPSFSASESTW